MSSATGVLNILSLQYNRVSALDKLSCVFPSLKFGECVQNDVIPAKAIEHPAWVGNTVQYIRKGSPIHLVNAQHQWNE